MKYSTVLIFSNNFGFGPLSRSQTIGDAVLAITEGIDVRIVAQVEDSKLLDNCMSQVDSIVDIRSEEILRAYLTKFNPRETLVISTMNRIALMQAIKLGYKTILLDGLYWFWPNRPAEYELADTQIRFVLPWQIENFRLKHQKRIYYFANPVDISEPSKDQFVSDTSCLITLNGFTTPFYKTEHDVYLDLMSELVGSLSKEIAVRLVGNSKIQSKLSVNCAEHFYSPSKKTFIAMLGNSRYVLLNGGSNSFLETLAYKKHFLFSLPSNQSQYALIAEVAKFSNSQIHEWCPLLGLFQNHGKILTFKHESDAIGYWSQQITHVLRQANFNQQLRIFSEQLLDKLERNTHASTTKKLWGSAKKSQSAKQEVAQLIKKLLV